MESRHLDGNPQNNSLSNLAWGTPVQNAEDRRRHGTLIRGSRHKLAKIKERHVTEIIRYAEAGVSQAVLAQRFGLSQSTICRIINGKRWKHVSRENS
jgi:DNA-binding XRE family transcriptional regulator